jgi:prepilin-type N-terminal cleavage/methylation domain-containing protein
MKESISPKRSVSGFTLIELLLVIAIIALLASVVMASLTTARAKGFDSAIKENLNGIRTQANLLRNEYGCFRSSFGSCATTQFAAGACAATAGTLFADRMIVEAYTKAASISGSASCVEALGAESWAISVPLKTNPAQSW